MSLEQPLVLGFFSPSAEVGRDKEAPPSEDSTRGSFSSGGWEHERLPALCESHCEMLSCSRRVLSPQIRSCHVYVDQCSAEVPESPLCVSLALAPSLKPPSIPCKFQRLRPPFTWIWLLTAMRPVSSASPAGAAVRKRPPGSEPEQL